MNQVRPEGSKHEYLGNRVQGVKMNQENVATESQRSETLRVGGNPAESNCTRLHDKGRHLIQQHGGHKQNHTEQFQ